MGAVRQLAVAGLAAAQQAGQLLARRTRHLAARERERRLAAVARAGHAHVAGRAHALRTITP